MSRWAALELGSAVGGQLVVYWGDLGVRDEPDDLHFGHVIRMRGRRQPAQDTELGEEERARADGHQGTLTRGVLLLQLGEGLDDGEGLVLGLEHFVGTAAGDDEDVDLGQALHGLGEVDVGAEGGALGCDHVLGGACEEDAEGFGAWKEGCC